jgi:FkbM family methyltransferase
MNVDALRWCSRISAWGDGLRSRSILFAVALLLCMDRRRRKPLRAGLRQYLRLNSRGGTLAIQTRPPAAPGKLELKFRLDDMADYQSITECFGDMYPVPRRRPIRYVLDGGANIGFFAISALRLDELQELVLVEPSPHNLPLLRDNARLVPGCSLNEAAIAGERGELVFDLATSNTGHLVSGTQAPGAKVVTVAARRIMDFIPSHWDAGQTWIKLDIEGAEYAVIRDLLRTGFRPTQLSAEIHDYLRKDGVGLVRELESHGYDVTVEGQGHEGDVCRQITAARRD